MAAFSHLTGKAPRLRPVCSALGYGHTYPSPWGRPGEAGAACWLDWLFFVLSCGDAFHRILLFFITTVGVGG